MNQLSLFDEPGTSDAYPLPVSVARKWQFGLSRHEQGEDVFYAIQDWIAGLASCDARKAVKMWNRIEKQMSISSRHLSYVANDGKTYQIPHTDDKGLYLIAQHMRSTKMRPALESIKQYLAKSGAFTDQQRLNPEIGVHAALDRYQQQDKDPAWIEARIEGIYARKQFTDAIKAVVCNLTPQFYGDATEITYIHLLERTTKQLRGALNLTIHQNPRDHMGQYALIYLGLTERIIADKLGDAQVVTEAVAIEIIKAVADMIHQQYQHTQKILGIDLVTEHKLLEPTP